MLNQLSANVNVSATPFYKDGNLAAALLSAGRDAVAHGFGYNLRVESIYLGYPRRYTITKIGKNSPSQQFFPCQEFGPEKISVADFFKRSAYFAITEPCQDADA